jgi:hypothetical protein
MIAGWLWHAYPRHGGCLLQQWAEDIGQRSAHSSSRRQRRLQPPLFSPWKLRSKDLNLASFHDKGVCCGKMISRS